MSFGNEGTAEVVNHKFLKALRTQFYNFSLV